MDEYEPRGTPMFASSAYYDRLVRYSVDDLQSLAFSIWYIAGVPMGRIDGDEPEGRALSKSMKKGDAVSTMLVCIETIHDMKLSSTRIFSKIFEFGYLFRKSVNILPIQL